MGTLDRIIEMQQKGLADTEITARLQDEGISVTEINDSFNQAKIKNAVSPPEPIAPQEMQPSITEAPIIPVATTPQPAPTQPMPQEVPIQPTAPQTPEVYPPQETYAPQPAPEPLQQPQENYYQETPQAYSQQDYYAPQGDMNTETISEIAEQVALEKLNEYKNKVGDIASFKNTIQDKVDDIDDRLKRIEDSIDKLQQAIIGKIGEFGESSAMIHKDLDNLHGTVSKLMDPLIDNVNELKKISK